MSDTAQSGSSSVDLDPAATHQEPSSSKTTSPCPPPPDRVIRPLTSQGSSTAFRPAPVTFTTRMRSSERPYTAHGTSSASPVFNLGPYMSASAHTSYTRVDVDSSPSDMYPPLPSQSIPPSSLEQNAASPASGGSTDVLATPCEPTTEATIPQTPQVMLTFLLVSGCRKSQSFDPETTVGRVKELVWNAWPTRDSAWLDERPPAPSYFRVLYLGKILQDDDSLIRLGFPTSLPSESAGPPTIVHLSIRPYGLLSDDPALSKKKRLTIPFARRASSGMVNADNSGVDEADRTGCCSGCVVC